MADENSNDNHLARGATDRCEPDAHGQAAMLLVESLIHGLIARSVIDVADAVDIVDTAADASQEIAADLGKSLPLSRTSFTILASISASLVADLPPGT